MSNRLSGRVIAITGAGRGIGAATATALTAEGARVAIGDIDLDIAKATAERIGGETLALPEGDKAARTALAKFASLDKSSGLLGRGIIRFDLRVRHLVERRQVDQFEQTLVKLDLELGVRIALGKCAGIAEGHQALLIARERGLLGDPGSGGGFTDLPHG